jgi:hypothetical protein
MSLAPDEPAAPGDEADAEAVARDLRRQLDDAKALMKEHRDQMQAAGLAKNSGGDTVTA